MVINQNDGRSKILKQRGGATDQKLYKVTQNVWWYSNSQHLETWKIFVFRSNLLLNTSDHIFFSFSNIFQISTEVSQQHSKAARLCCETTLIHSSWSSLMFLVLWSLDPLLCSQRQPSCRPLYYSDFLEPNSCFAWQIESELVVASDIQVTYKRTEVLNYGTARNA